VLPYNSNTGAPARSDLLGASRPLAFLTAGSPGYLQGKICYSGLDDHVRGSGLEARFGDSFPPRSGGKKSSNRPFSGEKPPPLDPIETALHPFLENGEKKIN